MGRFLLAGFSGWRAMHDFPFMNPNFRYSQGHPILVKTQTTHHTLKLNVNDAEQVGQALWGKTVNHCP